MVDEAASTSAGARTSRITSTCAWIAEDARFQGFIFTVIVANAVVLGLQTYDGIEREAGSALGTLDSVFIGIFVCELAIRIAAFGRRPQDFFRDGWNVFDFVVIAAAFAPGLRQNATLLRLARLLRVVRIVSVMPDLRVLARAMVRSLPPIGSLVVLTVLLIYVYGMVGWILFHDDDPENWATIGDAMLNLFIVLTLENWPTLLERGQEIHPASWVFFVSYILIASFLVINILIAIIVNSMEEVREAERQAVRARRVRRLTHGHGPEPGAKDAPPEAGPEGALERVRALRDALDELERELTGTRRPTAPTRARMRP